MRLKTLLRSLAFLFAFDLLVVLMGHGEYVLGTRLFLDLHSGRTRQISYFSCLPCWRTTTTNAVSIYVDKLNRPPNTPERWQLALTGGPLKSVWDSEPANGKAYAVSMLSGYLNDAEISEIDKKLLVKDFLGILASQHSREVKEWTLRRVEPELSRVINERNSMTYQPPSLENLPWPSKAWHGASNGLLPEKKIGTINQ